jgi:hypothetical protein
VLEDRVWQYRDAPLCLSPTAVTEYTVVLTADSVLARSTRRRQTSTGWNTPYIGANRYTLAPDEKPPADDALYPMAFSVEKLPDAVTRPHFHKADQFQVVVAGRGMLGDHDFSDGAVHYTDAYSAYGPIVAGKSGIWWFTLRNRWDPGARYMPAYIWGTFLLPWNWSWIFNPRLIHRNVRRATGSPQCAARGVPSMDSVDDAADLTGPAIPMQPMLTSAARRASTITPGLAARDQRDHDRRNR